MEGGGTPYSSGMAPSGSYILVIVSQPVTEEHKQVILQRLNKGLLSWDVQSTGCDLSGLESVCSSISDKHLNDNDVLIQHSTESLGVEILVSPTVSTLKQCIKNLFSTSTGHKQLIHAGYTFAGSGSWILQNGTFSFDEFLDIFQQADVQSQKRCNINVHCAEVGPWNSTNFAKDIFTNVANIVFNPAAKVDYVPGSQYLIECLNRVLNSQALEEMMEASPLVGNIRFNRPTLYMFPAGQGDCALFGINGFNMLVDGGFNRKPCSWEFIRHLDRLDAVLVTRLCENNLCGMATLMKRKALNNTYPQIGYVFCNIAEGKVTASKDDAPPPNDDLIVSVVGEGHNFVQTLSDLKLKPHQCWRDSSVEPFVLYHKVGHGTLEMHVLSPPRDSKEMKEFLTEWNAYKETFSCIKSGLKGKSLESTIPLSHATSICAVLVWRPADPKDTITRILFPGSAPQNKIFESLEKLKALDILNQPVVTKASLTTILVSKPVSNKVEKTISRASIPNRKNTASPALSVSSIASRNGDIGGIKKEVKETKKVSKEIKKDNKDIKEVKKEVKKEIKKEYVVKEVKKDIKTESTQKKEGLIKKESLKEVKKDNKEVKKVIKKDNKDVKTVTDKKAEIRSAPKKVETTANVSKTVSEVKKTATTVRKSTTPVKKDVGKPPITPKSTEAKKPTASRVSEPKAAKDVNNKKAAEAKTVPKTKPKSATTAAKSAPKTKPVAVTKPGSKMTKAVAASSIVASAVAVTAAAVELNEKKDEVVEDVEPEALSEKELQINAEEQKEVVAVEKSEEEINVSPLPPEALSPTPSESVSLTPSDTLSSAPLETVSPTPPLANEPISSEEKEVNEIKDIEPDNLPYETEEPADESGIEDKELEKATDEVNAIEVELAKQQEGSDVMSTSFIGGKDFGVDEVEDIVTQTQAAPTLESAPLNISHLEDKENDENIGNEKDINEEIEKYEEFLKHNDTEIKEINVDDQLQGLSMEGSFCAGIISSNEKETFDCTKAQEVHETEIETSVDELQNDLTTAEIHSEPSHKEQAFVDHVEYERELISQDQYHEQSLMPESEIINSEDKLHDNFKEEAEADKLQEQTESFTEIKHEVHESEMEENIAQPQAPLDIPEETKIISESGGIDTKGLDEKVDYEKDFDDSKYQENYETLEKQDRTDEMLTERRDPHVERLSQIQSMEESFHEEAFENFEQSSNIIDDVEMQESSVDEPEEIVRKESAVSITLNDEEPESNYADSSRRKSGTESEDDVDIQRYMAKEVGAPVDQEKLHVKQESESDDEDVVKSPTPHAVVDYEGHMEEAIPGVENRDDEEFEIIHEKEVYASEKQDFDEKERDSAEDQEDTDDGEMIRHPTPPNMKYSEEEMRDPIGQHYITAPGLKAQGSGITEQPLYEETEDYGSERSESPVVEQPVFGSVVEADFPELVTVSGGTTPSEPQSPKANFETKKFISESGVMEALSEHDISESSAYSPSCQDGSTTFDLQAEKNVLETESMQYIPHDEQTPEVKVETLPESMEDMPAHEGIHEAEATEAYATDVTGDIELESKLGIPPGEKQDAVSDDESWSHNEKSEPQSEDKSDAVGDDRSDIQGDDRSDMHGDDRSDIHGDDKSDVQGDDRSDIHGDDKSDIHGDDHSDIHGDERSDIQGDDRSDVHGDDRSDKDDRSDVQGDDRSDIQGEDRSDICDYKSNIHGEDRSDIHGEDRSDIHGEDRSDIHGDDRSDIHGDDRSNIHGDDRSDIHGDDRSDIHDDKSDIQEDRYDIHKSGIHVDRSDIYPDKSDPQFDEKSNVLHDDKVQDKSDKYTEEQDMEKSNILDTKASFHEQHELNIQENKSDHLSEIQSNYEMEHQCSDITDLKDYDKSEVQHETKSDAGEECGSDIQGEDEVQMANRSDIYDSSNILGHQIGGDVAFVTDNNIADVHEVNYGYQHQKISGVDENGVNLEEHLSCYSEQLNVEKSSVNKDLTQNSTVEPLDVINCSETGYGDAISNAVLKGEHSQTTLPAPDTYECNSHDYKVDEIELEDSKVDYESSNMSSFSHEVPQGEDKLGKLSIEQSEIYRDQVELHEVISPQHAENYSVIENKVLSEVTEAHQYEVLSQYEENTHTSNEVYSESSLTKNIVSDKNLHTTEVSSAENIDNANWQHVSNEAVSHTTTDAYEVTHTTSTYEYSTISGSGDIVDMNKFTHQKDIEGKICNDEALGTADSGFVGFSRDDNEESTFGLSEATANHETSKELTSYPDAEREYSHDDSKFMQTYTEKSFPAEIATDYHQQIVETVQQSTTHSNGFNSAMPQMNFNSTVHEGVHSVSETPFSMINGKDQSAFSVSSTEFAQHHFSETNSSHTVYTTSSIEKVEQESSYIINSRFHSDSPEDNVMRNDSSPEVPYPVESAGQFPDLKNSVTSESHQDSYLQNKDDFKGNLNFPNAGGIPLSPNNQTRNANREIPYGESSEDEDNSSLPGTVSPYAYTNKAYAREEEDMDGNHIYKEQSTEVIKQVEFDGNNPQTMTTQQMSSMSFSQGYQEMQYSGETNYDFHVEEWGKPMGLPTPPDSASKTVAKKTDKPATKSLSRTAGDASNGKAYSPTASTKLSSPLKKPKPKAAKESSSNPVYVDLAYVPHHGDPQYCDVEFFKKIRARYYVFSSINPSKEVLNALLEAKKTWNEDLDVTIIPTYETDTLGYWMAQNQDDLATYSIEVAPSASRCTVNLQDHETSCAAYRLEF